MDTIHVVFCYRERARAGYRRAVEHALSTVGPRINLTSLILMGGFGSMAVSEYLPTANFGMFSCLTTFAALVMDLTVLPLALSVRGGAAPASQAASGRLSAGSTREPNVSLVFEPRVTRPPACEMPRRRIRWRRVK